MTVIILLYFYRLLDKNNCYPVQRSGPLVKNRDEYFTKKIIVIIRNRYHAFFVVDIIKRK